MNLIAKDVLGKCFLTFSHETILRPDPSHFLSFFEKLALVKMRLFIVRVPITRVLSRSPLNLS